MYIYIYIHTHTYTPTHTGLPEPVQKRSPISLPKALKNIVELRGMRAAHVRDGVAMARTLSTLEERVESGGKETELTAAKIVLRERSRGEGCVFMCVCVCVCVWYVCVGVRGEEGR
jgi:Xaa-Pro aminopeptidase